MSPLQLGDVSKQSCQARHLIPRRPAKEVIKEDGAPRSPHYLNSIELHHRVRSAYVLRECAHILELDYDDLLAIVSTADVVVREYVS